ncbi:hypothetical protein ACES2L_01975 [Bdellovibrio bacteriovorus]
MTRFAFIVLSAVLLLSMANGKPIRPYYNPFGKNALHKHKGDVALAEAISKLSSRYKTAKYKPRRKIFVVQASTAKETHHVFAMRKI